MIEGQCDGCKRLGNRLSPPPQAWWPPLRRPGRPARTAPGGAALGAANTRELRIPRASATSMNRTTVARAPPQARDSPRCSCGSRDRQPRPLAGVRS
jgi:hypothetical protein